MLYMKNFLRTIVILLGTFFAVTANAQRVPDNDDILARIVDNTSPFYYPNLMSRYEVCDTTLTEEDYYYLYYGFAYSENYKPLKPTTSQDKLINMLSEHGMQFTSSEAEQIIVYAKETMALDPFSPQNLNFLVFAYGLLGDTEREKAYFKVMNKILFTIENSGTGIKESSPMQVLMFSHAADVLNARGVQIKNREVISRTVEYIFLMEKDDKRQKGYYFDFSRIYWNKPKPEDMPEDKKRSWTINDVKIK